MDKEGRRCPARYGSLPINERESRYSQPKLELFGLFRALRHFRFFVVGVKRLVVETDAKYIQGMLNAPDMQPNASMNRWVAGILLFTFELRHIPGRHHQSTDGLSRRPAAEDDDEGEDHGWLDKVLDLAVGKRARGRGERVMEVYGAEREEEEEWLGEIRAFLEDLVVPERTREKGEREVRRFVKKAGEFFVQKGAMYLRHRGDKEPRRVIEQGPDRARILASVHDGYGHRGVFATREAVAKRFWWPKVLADVHQYVASCHLCQLRSTMRPKIPLSPSSPTSLFQTIYVDVMFMPVAQGFKAIIAARDDLSGVSEGRAIKKVDAKTIAKFLQEEILLRYGSPEAMVTDNGSEFAGATRELLRRHNVPQIRISPYNSKANGVVERGHFNIREALVKFCEGDIKKWPNYVRLAFFADRITTRRATGVSPYVALHGVEPRLPIDLTEATFLSNGFREGMSSVALLSARMGQLRRRDQDLAEISEAVRSSRWGTKERYEQEYRSGSRRRNSPRGISSWFGTWTWKVPSGCTRRRSPATSGRIESKGGRRAGRTSSRS